METLKRKVIQEELAEILSYSSSVKIFYKDFTQNGDVIRFIVNWLTMTKITSLSEYCENKKLLFYVNGTQYKGENVLEVIVHKPSKF